MLSSGLITFMAANRKDTMGLDSTHRESNQNFSFGNGLFRINGTTADLVTRLFTGFADSEVFIIIGLHCFWLLSKSTPLTVDNAWGAILAAVPFAVMLVLGLGAFNTRIQAGLLRLEAVFHRIACLMLAVLLFYAVFQDPFSPLAPLTLPMFLWSIALTFLLAADLSAHLRRRASRTREASGVSLGMVAIIGFVLWAGTLWLAAGAAWVVYFWSVSLVLHAILAITCRRESAAAPARVRLTAGLFAQYLTVTETAFLLSLILLAQVLVPSSMIGMGALETKYVEYLDLFRSPAFLAGVVVFLLALRWRVTIFTHIAMAALLTFAAKENTLPLSAGLGYAISALFRIARRQCGFCYAFSCAAMSFWWILGLSGFTFSGMILFFDQGKAFVHDMILCTSLSVFLSLALWIGGLIWKRYKTNGSPAKKNTWSSVAPDMLLNAGLLIGVLGMALAPGLALLLRTEWPPYFMQRPDALAVDTPMGVCHAGYSESDDEYRLLKDLGVQAVRADFHWSCIQKAPDTWDFGCKEGFVDAAVRHGVQVIAILDFDNNTIEQDPVGKSRDVYIAPADIPLFLEYVRQTVTHFSDRVYAWEIWNEPNIARFWQGTAEEFYALTQQTAAAVHAVNPNARIIGPAMTGPLGALTSPNIDGIHAAGALQQVTHPSCHLYTTDPRQYLPEFSKIVGAARRFGHSGSPWITEVGAPDGGYYPWVVPTDRLAEHTIKAYVAATSLGFDKVVWYCLNDADASSQAKTPIDSERFFGLLGPDGRWKPSAYAYRLFSRYCSHSVMYPGLVHLSGGIAARQLRTALYRRENGESALILWFEPMLRPWGTARVRLDLGKLSGSAVWHDIGADYEKTLTDDHIEIGEKPVFITFQTDRPEEIAKISVTSSPVDALWLFGVAALALWAWIPCLRWRKSD